MNLYDSFMDFRQEYVFGREVKSRPAVRDEGRVKAEEPALVDTNLYLFESA